MGDHGARQTCCASSSAAVAGSRRSYPESAGAPGEPEIKLSNRGYGTLVRTDPVFLGLQKTRLLDPTQPVRHERPCRRYRASGCSACHVLYANDRDPVHSGALIAALGNEGPHVLDRRTIRRDEPVIR
jgi:hypothetical protein